MRISVTSLIDQSTKVDFAIVAREFIRRAKESFARQLKLRATAAKSAFAD
jgi:hypothetical protein